MRPSVILISLRVELVGQTLVLPKERTFSLTLQLCSSAVSASRTAIRLAFRSAVTICDLLSHFELLDPLLGRIPRAELLASSAWS